MAVIDLILNLVGLAFWLNWRSLKLAPVAASAGISLAGIVRRAEPRRARGWPLLLALAVLLFLRGLVYWQIGSAVNWTPKLELGVIAISFRSDFLARTLLFSALSFVLTLVVFYLWLLLLSLVNGRGAEAEPLQKFVRLHLGGIAPWPWPLRLLLPLVIASVLWLALTPILTQWRMIPAARSAVQRLEQAGLLGLGVYLTAKYLIIALLALYLVNSYIYLGSHSFWNFIGVTGRNLLLPLRWLPLRVGKMEFRPVVGIALVSLGAELAERGLTSLYSRLAL